MSFKLEETTIRDIHEGYLSGQLTCVRLVQAYLDRISAYDQSGPVLNAFVKLNPAVLEEAAALDARPDAVTADAAKKARLSMFPSYIPPIQSRECGNGRCLQGRCPPLSQPQRSSVLRSGNERKSIHSVNLVSMATAFLRLRLRRCCPISSWRSPCLCRSMV